ncbi:MAG: hydroxymethylglutaryl-CoA lyase [Planctomycetota bacterium]
MKIQFPKQVHIVEVGPRDGLQNESQAIPTDVKLQFIQKLADAGLTQIEATSFVHPKAIPQLADAEEVAKSLLRKPGLIYSALVPNEKGLRRALDCGIRRLAVFTATTESFTRNNIHMTVEESLQAFAPIIREACANGVTVRGYLSCCFVCPFEGAVSKHRVLELAQRLLDIGVNQVAISDTIGVAVPTDVLETVGFLLEKLPTDFVALHFHDTYGTALANVFAGLQLGIETFDSSAGGLGGCPFAPGAAGNLATEDLVYMLEKMGIDTGVDLQKVVEASSIIAQSMGRDLPSRVWRRLKTGTPSSSPD